MEKVGVDRTVMVRAPSMLLKDALKKDTTTLGVLDTKPQTGTWGEDTLRE